MQPEVIENRPQASELMRLLLDLLPYISNAQGYAKKLFSTGFPQETLTQLVDIHLDRGLQLVIKHFPFRPNSPICQFIVAQLPPALEIQSYLVSALDKGEIESFLFYAVKNFYRFDPKSTPRSLIIHKQFNALLNTLFAKGCDIGKYNSQGQTVLAYALDCIHWEKDEDWQKDRLCELVEILINAGANCNYVTNEGNTFLMMACRYKKPELVSLLIQQPQIAVNAKNIFDLSALSFAVDDLAVLQALLQHPEIDVNIKNHDGESLLYDAVRENKLETVQALRAHQPRFDDLNKRDMKGKSLLDYVMKKNNLPLLEVLLQYAKIDVNKINARGGYNPLHYAVEKRNLPLIQRLLQHPTIDVNAKDKDGNSVLEYVLESRHLPLIENFFTSTIDLDARLFIFNTLILRGQSKVCIGLLQTMDESQHETFINQALARARQENRLSVAS
ncbi:ankyrin repeat domain-containing protein, partial [Parachlamydia acanthamoebae]|uniref:ankyrin repeat domain-containing protein n=1 Tax=Parachlamydia acanthamoebae TaxID=83552 RepID=UPI00057DD837